MLRPVGQRGRASRNEPFSMHTSSVQGSEAGASGSSGGTSVGGGASVGGGGSVGGGAVGCSTSGSVGGGSSVGGAGSVASGAEISSVGELVPDKQAADTTKMMIANVRNGRDRFFFIRFTSCFRVVSGY